MWKRTNPVTQSLALQERAKSNPRGVGRREGGRAGGRTDLSVGHAPLVLLRYICYVGEHHGEGHGEHAGDGDDSKVPPGMGRQRARTG